MRLRFDVSFGSDSRRKAVVRKKDAGVLYPVGGTSRGGWWPVIRESFTGAWQRNIEVNFDSALAFHAVYSCVTLISNDFGKLANVLYEWDDDERIWLETDSPAFSPVLRKPNKYQNHVQFKEWYAMSKLLRGNVYVLKERDQRGVVIAEYVLDPNRVKPLVTEDGSIYYQLGADNLVNDLIEVERVVPASEIIHDRMNCLYHPLVGVSPLFACGLAAMQGLAIQNNSTTFFGNQSRPSGILTAPGHIKKATADRLKENWEANYSGANYGKVAILGDDLKYQPLSVSAADAQMVEQLKMSAEIVCSCFHVPPFKIGLQPMPAVGNAELANQIYYSDCLQSHIEQYEACQDEGLGIGFGNAKEGTVFGVGLDLDGLLKMDTKTKVETLAAAVSGALLSPDEARQQLDRPRVPGGKSPYLQQQNFSLEALAKRDAQADPFAKPPSAAPPALPAPAPEPEESEAEPDMAERTLAALRQELAA